jgi:hypothetical protein
MSKGKAITVRERGQETLIIQVSTKGIYDKALCSKTIVEEIERVIRNHKAYEEYVLRQDKALKR